MGDAKYNFRPAAPDEDLVYGACRPCYPGFSPEQTTVPDWISYMQDQQIDRVCCLLSNRGVENYDNLLATYADTFGRHAVCHAPIPDYTLVDKDLLHDTILPFLAAGVAAEQRTVVHCSAGQGRTGHVLALWLASNRDYSLPDAVTTVRETGRSPLEANEATLQKLQALLSPDGNTGGAHGD